MANELAKSIGSQRLISISLTSIANQYLVTAKSLSEKDSIKSKEFLNKAISNLQESKMGFRN